MYTMKYNQIRASGILCINSAEPTSSDLKNRAECYTMKYNQIRDLGISSINSAESTKSDLKNRAECYIKRVSDIPMYEMKGIEK